MILITGFAPYKEALNASAALISSMQSDLPGGLRDLEDQLAFEIIGVDETSRKTEHQTLEAQLFALLTQYKPVLCIFTGQAPPYNKIICEKVALNSFMDEVIDAEGSVAYWADLPGINTLPAAVEAQNIPAAHSYYAGQHLCNHILYSSLAYAEEAGLPHRSGFIHIPVLPEQVNMGYKNAACMPLSMTRKALSTAIQHVVKAKTSFKEM